MKGNRNNVRGEVVMQGNRNIVNVRGEVVMEWNRNNVRVMW
jgi:hypothetical protein